MHFHLGFVHEYLPAAQAIVICCLLELVQKPPGDFQGVVPPMPLILHCNLENLVKVSLCNHSRGSEMKVSTAHNLSPSQNRWSIAAVINENNILKMSFLHESLRLNDFFAYSSYQADKLLQMTQSPQDVSLQQIL